MGYGHGRTRGRARDQPRSNRPNRHAIAISACPCTSRASASSSAPHCPIWNLSSRKSRVGTFLGGDFARHHGKADRNGAGAGDGHVQRRQLRNRRTRRRPAPARNGHVDLRLREDAADTHQRDAVAAVKPVQQRLPQGLLPLDQALGRRVRRTTRRSSRLLARRPPVRVVSATCASPLSV